MTTRTRKSRKPTKKQIDARVERAYYDTCSGIQIDIMDIGKVFQAGRNAIKDGVDDETLRKVIRNFVESIRKN